MSVDECGLTKIFIPNRMMTSPANDNTHLAQDLPRCRTSRSGVGMEKKRSLLTKPEKTRANPNPHAIQPTNKSRSIMQVTSTNREPNTHNINCQLAKPWEPLNNNGRLLKQCTG